MVEQKFWTTGELARIAKVDGSYIRRLCGQGRIRAVKFGRDWAIPDDVAKAWLARRMEQGKLL